MPFQKGNQLARGGPNEEERIDIRRITLKVWRIAEKVINDEHYVDPDFRQRLIEKIVSRSAPQNLDIGGQNGMPIVVQISKEVADKNDVNVSPSSTVSNS